jgi:branched-chain amino acid transport system ATP-binding protein
MTDVRGAAAEPAPAEPQPLLELADVDVVYQEVIRALRGVSLRVAPGSIVALLGPNGAGKSTTLRAITGLLPFHKGRVARGKIRFAGEHVTGAKASTLVRRGIAQALEGRRIFAGLTVTENIRLGAQGRATGDAMERMLGLFPVLAERRNQVGGLLSGGEQQMLAMARALVSDPRLLVLDEPSLGLAPKVVDQVAELIVRINAEGTTVLVVEQNASVALDIAHHGYVLESGRVVLDGPTHALRADEEILSYYLGAAREEKDELTYADVTRHRRHRRIS